MVSNLGRFAGSPSGGRQNQITELMAGLAAAEAGMLYTLLGKLKHAAANAGLTGI